VPHLNSEDGLLPSPICWSFCLQSLATLNLTQHSELKIFLHSLSGSNPTIHSQREHMSAWSMLVYPLDSAFLSWVEVSLLSESSTDKRQTSILLLARNWGCNTCIWEQMHPIVRSLHHPLPRPCLAAFKNSPHGSGNVILLGKSKNWVFIYMTYK
jgi:hypothetical protein